VRSGKSIELLDGGGRVVGRLAKRYVMPNGMTPLAASVAGIVRRDVAATDPEYHGLLKSEVWEVVVPELVFDPAIHARASASA
jgi:ATP-dependent DNA helicase RecQ